jgi:hypothetical protein
MIPTIISVMLFAGCSKEELPPLKCYTLNFNCNSNVPFTKVDSVFIHLERSDINDPNPADTMIINPPFNFKLQFCGVFKYRFIAYHNITQYPFVTLDVYADQKALNYEVVESNKPIEGIFIFEQ